LYPATVRSAYRQQAHVGGVSDGDRALFFLSNGAMSFSPYPGKRFQGKNSSILSHTLRRSPCKTRSLAKPQGKKQPDFFLLRTNFFPSAQHIVSPQHQAPLDESRPNSTSRGKEFRQFYSLPNRWIRKKLGVSFTVNFSKIDVTSCTNDYR